MQVSPSVVEARPVAQRASGRAINWRVVVPLGFVVLIVLVCFLGPTVFNVPGANAGSLNSAFLPPFTGRHLLGTNAIGNDMFSQVLYGGQVSIVVGVSSVAIGIAVGGTLGVIAGYSRGAVEAVIMRVLDMFLAFPALVLALLVANYLGPSERNVIFAIAFFTVPAFGRRARADTLEAAKNNYVISARLMGGRTRRVVFRHLVPNVAPALFTYGIITVAAAMVIEAGLDYLGLGVRPPQPSWGDLIEAGQTYLQSAPWIVLAPSICLWVTVLVFNWAGDALRQAWSQS